MKTIAKVLLFLAAMTALFSCTSASGHLLEKKQENRMKLCKLRAINTNSAGIHRLTIFTMDSLFQVGDTVSIDQGQPYVIIARQ